MRRPESGMTLVEALIAVAIVGIVAVGAMMALDNTKLASEKISRYDASRQIEGLMRVETTRAVHDLIEGGGAGASICALTPAPGLVKSASVLALTPFSSAAIPAGAPAEWQQMGTRCAGGNSFSGAKGTLCFRLGFNDARLAKHFPAGAVEVTVALTQQKNGAALSCSTYRSAADRGFHSFYSIYYAKQVRNSLEFHTFTGTFYGGGTDDW